VFTHSVQIMLKNDFEKKWLDGKSAEELDHVILLAEKKRG